MRASFLLCGILVPGYAYLDVHEDLFDSLLAGSGLVLTDSEKFLHKSAFVNALSTSRISQNAREIFQLTRPAILQSTADEINGKPGNLWRASNKVARFDGVPLGTAKRQCGSTLNSERKARLPVFSYSEADDIIPDSFDSRKDFGPLCASLIGTARDQSNCGSCWSFSTTTALEDRLCLEGKGGDETASRLKLSPLDTLSCCNSENGCNSYGCDGGDPASAWDWFVSTGVVSGGDYGESGTCKPYAFPTCAHHVNVPDLKPCSGDSEYSTPACETTCSNNASYEGDKHRSLTAYTVEPTEKSIKIEILRNGPVSAAFMVYEDFLTYTGGIYHHVTGQSMGGHAVKLIGWGEENGVKFWLLLNSWNPSWGEQGAFRMKLHEGGIMDEITAGQVRLENIPSPLFETQTI